MQPRISIRGSVHPSVRPLVHPSVCLSVRRSRFHQNSRKSRISSRISSPANQKRWEMTNQPWNTQKVTKIIIIHAWGRIVGQLALFILLFNFLIISFCYFPCSKKTRVGTDRPTNGHSIKRHLWLRHQAYIPLYAKWTSVCKTKISSNNEANLIKPIKEF